MAPDASCAQRFNSGIIAHDPNILQYQYNGTVRGIYEPTLSFITYYGCVALCGTDPAYYDWTDVSATISTWVLPIVGLLLQAPFESNAFWKTVLAICHWLGSPISSLSSILWNIKVFGQCSLIVDMATQVKDVPGEDSQFAQMRDSFYILSVMNQFSLKPTLPRVEAERLLRIALFSDSLQLETVDDESRNLVKRRKKLAKTLREGRKKGVVPVFISLLWFLFSLVISIQGAFGLIGSKVTARNLAMGLLLAWLPTFVLCSIVDRNPTQPEATQAKLNKLVDAVRKALLNPELRDTYIKDTGRSYRSFSWTTALENDDFFREDFFIKFAGQGRVRWHYGIAHGVLSGIEDAYVAKHGRNWLRDSEEARTALVKGPTDMHGLVHEFNPKELWQVLASFLIVSLSITGTLLLEYWTPTIGLGCLSGGYMIFYILAVVNLLIELLCWRYLNPEEKWDEDVVTRIGSNIQRRISRNGKENHVIIRWAKKFSAWWQSSSKRDVIDALVLRPLEFINTAWLVYVIISETVGSHNSCECECSIWGLGSAGGYMDFSSQSDYLEQGVGWIWASSTAIACVPMVIAFIYIVTEWCLQSHLSTVNYEKAKRGLLRTRRFRMLLHPIQHSLRTIRRWVASIWRKIVPKSMTHRKRSSVEWTRRPKITVETVSTSHDQLESAIDDRPFSPGGNHNDETLGLVQLSSPSRSINRSPRSSFGQVDISEVSRPRPFV